MQEWPAAWKIDIPSVDLSESEAEKFVVEGQQLEGKKMKKNKKDTHEDPPENKKKSDEKKIVENQTEKQMEEGNETTGHDKE